MSIIVRTRPAVKPTHRTVRPTRPFGEGIFPDRHERRMPYTADDLVWWAAESNHAATDFNVAADPFEELTEEYHKWLDSLAPEPGELEARDRCDAFLGHD
jgi:hypothetical protein